MAKLPRLLKAIEPGYIKLKATALISFGKLQQRWTAEQLL